MILRDIFLNMSGPPRRKRRSRRDILRNWNSRFKAFSKAGFSHEEATWAANWGVSIRQKDIRKQVKMRRARVRDRIDLYGDTREQAIRVLSRDLRSKLDEAGIDDWNIFYESS